MQVAWTDRFGLMCLVAASASLAPAQHKQKPLNKNLNTPLPLASDTARQPAGSQLDSPRVPDPAGTSTLASPLAPVRAGMFVPEGAAVSVRMSEAVDSGSFRNGDPVHGVLAAPVKTSAGTTLASGTRVEGTVVAAARAGVVQSGGVLSLQLTRVGPVPVVTDVLSFNGQEGHKDVPDAAPEKGTEARVAAGTTVTFHVLENGTVPGLEPQAPLLKTPAQGRPVNLVRGARTSTGQPGTRPGVNHRPVGGATQGIVPAGVGPK